MTKLTTFHLISREQSDTAAALVARPCCGCIWPRPAIKMKRKHQEQTLTCDGEGRKSSDSAFGAGNFRD